jgi:glycosyltransferase involved in cell wall biosynthesis
MIGKALAPLSVFHLMRTYGAHGGEQQLSQYFGAEPRGHVSETFVFVYRDPECSRLFAKRAPDLEQIDLGKAAVPTGSAWRELAMLLPRLPLLQLRFLALMRKRRPGVCMVHGFQGALVAWPAAILCPDIRWGYVHRITKSGTGSHPIFRMIYRPFVAMAGNSTAVTASLEPLTTSDRLVTLDNGLDWRSFEARAAAGAVAPLPPSNGPVLISVGRLLPHKGQSMLIDAFDTIADSFSDVSLWIVGDGTEMEHLRRRATVSPAAGRIHLLGRREDVPALLARADVFVNASSSRAWRQGCPRW